MSKARDLADSVAAGSVLADGVVSVSEITSASGANLNFADNSKAIFGAGSDLQIYHDATDSIILDNGTGNLRLLCENFRLQDPSEAETYITADKDGAVGLRFNDSQKLATTSTGIDVTGTVVADGLTVDGLVKSDTASNGFRVLKGSGAYYGELSVDYISNDVFTYVDSIAGASYNGIVKIRTANNGGSVADRVRISSSGVSFYEDTGTTPKFFWDASAESLGIGTSSPQALLEVSKATGSATISPVEISIRSTTNASDWNTTTPWGRLKFTSDDASGPDTRAAISVIAEAVGGGGASLLIETNGAERLRITSAGNLGLGVTPSAGGATADYKLFEVGSAGGASLYAGNGQSLFCTNVAWSGGTANYKVSSRAPLMYSQESGTHVWKIAPSGTAGDAISFTQAMTLTADGNLGIGTSSPATTLSVDGAGTINTEIMYFVASGGSTSQPGIWLGGNNTSGSTTAIGNRYSIIRSQPVGGSARSMYFQTGTDTRMVLSHDGNLLVGKTVTAETTQGVRISETGQVIPSKTSGPSIVATRLSSDGEIIRLAKDGTTVGSIGISQSGAVPYIGGTNTGICFNSATNGVLPADTSTPTAVQSDATKDLGFSTIRWRNLYLSGGVYLGGTAAANHLDDYEEGTWTPEFTYATPGTLSITYNTRYGAYTKVGNLVTVTGQLRLSAFIKGTASGSLRITGLPFTNRGVAGGVRSPIFFATYNAPFNGPAFTGFVDDGDSSISCFYSVNNTAWANQADPDANSEYFFTVAYFV